MAWPTCRSRSPAAGGSLARSAQDAVNKALAALIGRGDARRGEQYTDIYLSEAGNAQLRKDPKFVAAAIDALRGLPGDQRVFRGGEVATAQARSSSDPVRRAAALSYHHGRSGDLIIVPKEGWLLSSSVTTHGTLYPYDQRVPVILFGAVIGRRISRSGHACRPDANARSDRGRADLRNRRTRLKEALLRP